MWTNIINEIRELGSYSDQQIADYVESSQPAINRLRNGQQSEPSYSLGEKLKRLHRQVKRKARKAL